MQVLESKTERFMIFIIFKFSLRTRACVMTLTYKDAPYIQTVFNSPTLRRSSTQNPPRAFRLGVRANDERTWHRKLLTYNMLALPTPDRGSCLRLVVIVKFITI